MRNDFRSALRPLIDAYLKDDLTIKEVIAYASAIAAILFGAVLLWWPPAAVPTPGNVAIAFAFITGGFATLGVTITIPTANRSGFALGYAAGIQGATFSGVGQLNGHPSHGHGYIEITKLSPGQARQVANDLRPFMAKHGGTVPGIAGARIDSVSIMADKGGGTQKPLPDGDTVVVECSATQDDFASPQAHKTLEDLAKWVPGVTGNKGLIAHFCCVSDM